MFVAYVKPVPWVMNAASNIPYADRAVRPFRDYCSSLVDEKMSVEREEKEMPSNIISWILREYRKKTPYAPKTRNALNSDARTIATAGADTSSNTLTSALFYLARNPSFYTRLQSEVAGVFPGGPETFSYDVLSKNLSAVPMLDAVINETLRLRPAVPSGNPRVTPPEGLTIPLVDKSGNKEDLFIPGDVDVYVPPYWVHRDPNYFPDPEAFLPDRWLGGATDRETTEGSLSRGKRQRGDSYTIGPREMEVFFPFQVGQFACPGKNLAMWEMRSFLARMALRFDFDFAGPSAKDAGAAFEHGMRDTFVITLEPLWMRFKESA
ncbi:putative cytochrome p450 [Diaporthe ampelina]|uniref:Putative cytochrome p450 n=1 Tax=Diaporthe ampelina TaxID=1214573 RepID=A0A0G2FY95_9PEZI|nr:putative cytochrome p450 [Diaporthe ampelina]